MAMKVVLLAAEGLDGVEMFKRTGVVSEWPQKLSEEVFQFQEENLNQSPPN